MFRFHYYWIFLFLGLFFGSILNSHAQTLEGENIEALLSKLENAETTAEKVTVLRGLGSLYQAAGQYEIALPHYLRAERLLTQNGDPKKVLDLKYDIGKLYQNWDIPKQSLSYFWGAYQGYDALGETQAAQRALAQAAAAATHIGDTPKAISYYQKLEESQGKNGQLNEVLATQSLLANLYREIKQEDATLNYQKKALETAQQLGNQEKIGIAYNNLGYTLRQNEQFEDAQTNFEKALNAFEEMGLEETHSERLIALNNLAVVQQNQGNTDASLRTFERLENIYQREENEKALAEVQHRKATILYYGNLFQDALKPIDEAIRLAIKNKQNELLSQSYKTKSKILNELGEPRKALELLDLSNKIKAQLAEEKNEAERLRVQNEALANQAQSKLALDMVAEEKELLELDKLRSDSIRKAKEIELLRERQINDSLKIAEERKDRERARTQLKLVQQRLANERKNQEIQDLQQQQRLQAMQLQQAELEQQRAEKAKESAEQAEKLAKQREELQGIRRQEAERRNYFFIAIGVVLLFGVFLILFFLRKIQRTNHKLKAKNDQISAQKQQIEGKNTEINLLLTASKEKNEQLLASEEELRQNSEELQAINENLERTSVRLEKSLESEIESKQKLRHTLDKLKDAQSQLVQSEKMSSLGQLTAGIAHEINNPINFINSGADSVQLNYQDILEILTLYASITPENVEDKLDEVEDFKDEIEFEEVIEETTELIAGIKSGAERTAEIVKGLRTFSRLDESDLKRIKIEEGLDSTLVMLRNQHKGRVEIHKDYSETKDVECYAGKLNQVFMNILANAMQAIPEKGDIFITTKMTDADHIQIAIRDTGKGMPESVKKRIFEPFFTTKDVGKGTGLGLSISFSIIEKHNGTLEVDSEEGKGTTFRITLPVRHKEHT